MRQSANKSTKKHKKGDRGGRAIRRKHIISALHSTVHTAQPNHNGVSPSKYSGDPIPEFEAHKATVQGWCDCHSKPFTSQASRTQNPTEAGHPKRMEPLSSGAYLTQCLNLGRPSPTLRHTSQRLIIPHLTLSQATSSHIHRSSHNFSGYQHKIDDKQARHTRGLTERLPGAASGRCAGPGLHHTVTSSPPRCA